MSETTSARRVKVRIPRAAAESLSRGTGPGRPPGATLIHGWLSQAARYAREGRTDLVPVRHSLPQDSDTPDVFYKMTPEESAEMVKALRGAGSSVSAVVTACIAAWEAAGYNAVTMQWPSREEGTQTAA